MNNFHMREGKVEFRWKRWRNKKRQEVSSCLMVLFSGAVLLGGGGVALAGPTGGQVTGGQGTITNPNGTTTNINQQSNVLNINWQDFSIGAGETVNFIQPGSTSIAINRVIGGVPSYLAGALNANGRVFILNSAGITFTGTSQVNVGALLATTAMTVNGDPTQAASYSGTGYGAVINQGSISVSNGGFAILAAPYVQNTGFIKADLGTIALAGTNQFTLDLSGTGLINFVVPAGAVEKIVSDGKAVGVNNSGTLQARSGQVVISANVASEVVNAVVNLNGIVDADAFAADGKGGSVLVTAAGDINVGGQVTAKGSGAGAGGQIITKAAGADVIGSMAYVSAAGGAAGGKGGFIEVSGKQVGLHGNIDPGSGGSLLIDPANIFIVAGTHDQANGADSSVGTQFIENQLFHNVDVSLVANVNIEFRSMIDNVLVGGNGNLSLTAGNTTIGNIIMDGTRDAIVQGGGFIHINANGGNIGSSGHTLSLVTGKFPAQPATNGVTQAGDIVLSAGHDIHVRNVQILSSGSGSLHALFSANAGHDFVASGNINVAVVAHGNSAQHAHASANIFANSDVSAHNVSVTALANQTQTNATSQNATAEANLFLNAHNAIQVSANVLVDASAIVHGRNGVALANANADLTGSEDVTVGGNIQVIANAVNPNSSAGNAFASANLQVDAADGSINLARNVTVRASANDGGGINSVAYANAFANMQASEDISVGGDVTLKANAVQSNPNGDGANADASLQVDAERGRVDIEGGVNVVALARSSGTDSVLANAAVNVFANTDLTINGNVTVTANAVHFGLRSSSAIANANLQLQANTGTIHLNHGINVSAYAEQHGSESAVAVALANLTANQSVDVDGNTVVNARANYLGSDDDFGAVASANLLVNAHNVVDLGGISVNANALARHGSESDEGAFANAQANANILGSDVTIGNATVTAHANGTEDGAIANATLQVVDSAFIRITGNVDVEASAHGEFSEFVTANALVNLQGHDITVDGATKVLASVSGFDAFSIHAVAALVVNAQGDITLHDVDVEASGFASFAHSAYASAAVSLNGQNVIVDGTTNVFGSLGGHDIFEPIIVNAVLTVNAQVNAQLGAIDVEADGSLSTTEGFLAANALASINAENIAVLGNTKVTAELRGERASAGNALANLIVHANHDASFQGVDVEAAAEAFDIGAVNADALASFTAHDHLSVNGPLKVIGRGTATDVASFGASGNLQVAVSTGNASFNAIDIEGLANVDDVGRIHANAMISDVGVGFVAHGALKTLASANGTALHSASMFAQTQIYIQPNATASFQGGVNVSAVAFDRDTTTGPNAELASALFHVQDANVINVEDGIKVEADALEHFGGLTSANASVFLQAPHVNVQGVTSVLANATGDNGGSVNANATLLASGANDVTLGGINVQADADNLASGNVSAIAMANIVGSEVTVGDAIVKSMATGHGGVAVSNATLLVTDSAFIHMTGSINVEADLVDFDASTPNYGAEALASLNGHTIQVDGPARVVAKTTGSQGSSIVANALFNVNAQTTIRFENTIDVVASVDGHGAGFVNANPVAQFNGTSLQVDDTLTVLANAHGSSVGGISAVPTLNIQNVAQATFNGIDVNAFAHGNNVTTIEASASLLYSGHSNFTDHGRTKVTALASGSSASGIQADANLFISVTDNASFGGGIDVTASALQHDNGAVSVVANAFANTVAGSSLTLGNDYTVTAHASASTANTVTAQAIGFMRAHDINMTAGNVDVAATANGGSNVVGTVAAVATFDAEANGAVTINGDVSVTANVVYEPNSSHFDQGTFSGSTHGNVFLLANGNIQAGTGDINIGGNINVSATLRSKAASFGSFFSVLNFGEGSQYLQKTPTALLTIIDHSGSHVNLQGVTVSANAQLEGNHFEGTGDASSNLLGGAIAIATIVASDGGVNINGPVTVEATLNAPGAGYSTEIPKFGLIGAIAALNVSASGEINAQDVAVTADANVAFVQGFGLPLIGDAIAIANFSGSSVRIGGDVNVQATYGGLFVSQGLTVAALHISASNGPATVDGDVTVNAQTNMIGTETEFGFLGAWDEYVIASASIEADNEALVTGNFNVTAGAQQAPVKFTAFGGANAEMDGSFVSVGGNFDVEALANVTSAERVVADAHGGLFGSHGVEVDGSVTVNALAVHGNNMGEGTESGLVISKAVFSAAADNSGSVSIHHNLTVHANTVEDGTGDGVALALASANVFGESGVAVGGVVSAKADLLDYASGAGSFSTTFGPFAGTVLPPIPLFHYSSVRGGLASAQVNIEDDHSHGVSLGGLAVTANANVQNPNFAIDSQGAGNASAIALANVISNHGPVDIAGNVIGSARAHDAGWGGAVALSLIDLEPAASTQATDSGVGLHIGGNVAMNALADGGTHAEGSVLAVAVLNADADRGGVRIDGNVQLRANAQDLSEIQSPGSAAAYANAHLEGDSGVSVGGGIAVLASLDDPANGGQSPLAFKFGNDSDDNFTVQWGHAEAVALLSASDGGVSVGGLVRASAQAIGHGSSADSHLTAATAQVNVEAGDGNIRIGGAKARAVASGTDGSNASANANVKLHAASGSINVSPAGITATALAFASFGTHANALGSIAADADGGIFIRGNVISLAVAISDGTGNIAHAKTHLAAGGANSGTNDDVGSLGTGFGNIVVIGNIGAFAAADASNDRATASVEIYAHNNILIVGNDPIASAKVGPSGGTTFAFRQANFTTNQFASGQGGEATADIDIRAGGSITVVPPSSLTRVEKLYSLPTDLLTLNSSGGLTIIPLAVQDDDCGVLGIAGMDQTAINKAISCHRKPINVSDLTDTGP